MEWFGGGGKNSKKSNRVSPQFSYESRNSEDIENLTFDSNTNEYDSLSEESLIDEFHPATTIGQQFLSKQGLPDNVLEKRLEGNNQVKIEPEKESRLKPKSGSKALSILMYILSAISFWGALVTFFFGPIFVGVILLLLMAFFIYLGIAKWPKKYPDNTPFEYTPEEKKARSEFIKIRLLSILNVVLALALIALSVFYFTVQTPFIGVVFLILAGLSLRSSYIKWKESNTIRIKRGEDKQERRKFFWGAYVSLALATLSIVLLFSFWNIFLPIGVGIASLVLAIYSLRHINQNAKKYKGRGMCLAIIILSSMISFLILIA